jgi:RNase P/RNase MRP subunit p29
VTLGEEVGIGGFSKIFTHGSWQSELDGFPIASGGGRVGDFSWIGAGAIIFAGVEIGEFATVGGGTVMRRRVPSYSLAAGNPGKVVLQKGEHLVHVTEEDRFELCRRIVLEVADQSDWTGRKVDREDSAEGCRVTIDGEVLLFRRQPGPSEDVNAVISFERMSEAQILECEAAGIDWFDLDRRRCSHAMTGLSAVVRGIFSNHGVRFQTTGRGAITGAPDKRRGCKPASGSGGAVKS